MVKTGMFLRHALLHFTALFLVVTPQSEVITVIGPTHLNVSTMLGGLFPVHTKGKNEDQPCGDMLLEESIQRLEAMLFAIDLVNANPQMWKISVNAKILDTCSSDSFALEQSLKFLQSSCGAYRYKRSGDEPNVAFFADNVTQSNRVIRSQSNRYSRQILGNTDRRVSAVIGAAKSEVTESVANILRLYKIPQVSYASTSKELDDIHRYPYFFRVVPSDRFQVQAMKDILLRFHWSYVSIIASEGEYGSNALSQLEDIIQEASNEEVICFAVKATIPRNADDQVYDKVIKDLLLYEHVNVVILFLKKMDIRSLFDACERNEVPVDRFLWLGSDEWGAKLQVVRERDQDHSQRVEGAITLLPKRFPVTEFDTYFKSLKPSTNVRNPWFKEFWEVQFNCYLDERRPVEGLNPCTGDEDLSETYRQEGLVPMVIDAVHLVAKAAQRVCEERGDLCNNPDKEPQHQNLLKETIRTTEFHSIQGNDMMIKFDSSRSVPVNYTVYQYQLNKKSNKYDYKNIGEWNPYNGLTLVDGAVWDKPFPKSRCSEECGPGEERVYSLLRQRQCCWTCKGCKNNTYKPTPASQCVACPDGQVPELDWGSCVEASPVYLGQHLDSAWALVPLVISLAGLICTGIVMTIFILNRKTPIIMASGRELCYLIFIGIICCYCFTFLLLLKPSEITCGCGRIGMGLGLAFCYSAIFTKTNRLSRIFNLTKVKRPSYISPESQVVICICLVLIQVTLATMWMIVQPPKAHLRFVESSNNWVLGCGVNGISIMLNLLYNMFLLILCTIYAFKTRNIPANFNETKCIGYTVYSSCIVWMAYVPLSFSALENFKVQSTILGMSMSMSGTVTLACLFLPKVYVVLFRPERNVREACYPSSSGNSGTGVMDSSTDSAPVRFLRSAPGTPGAQRKHSPRANFLGGEN